MRDRIRKLGWLALSVTAALLFLLIQLAVQYGAMTAAAMAAGGGFADVFRDTPAGDAAWAFAETYSAELMLAGQLICLALVLPLWYGAFYRKLRSGRPAPAPRRALWGLLPAGLGIQLLCDVLVWLESLVFPRLVEEYSQLMEDAGVGQLHWQILLATVLLAPVLEELCCRGVILGCAEKAFASFGAANLVQALLFGLLHLNWVQGVYAFLIGLLLGLVYRRWRRIGYCILLHGAVNAGSLLAGPLQAIFFPTAASLVLMAAFGALLLGRGLRQMDLKGLPQYGQMVHGPSGKKWTWRQ